MQWGSHWSVNEQGEIFDGGEAINFDSAGKRARANIADEDECQVARLHPVYPASGFREQQQRTDCDGRFVWRLHRSGTRHSDRYTEGRRFLTSDRDLDHRAATARLFHLFQPIQPPQGQPRLRPQSPLLRVTRPPPRSAKLALQSAIHDLCTQFMASMPPYGAAYSPSPLTIHKIRIVGSSRLSRLYGRGMWGTPASQARETWGRGSRRMVARPLCFQFKAATRSREMSSRR